MAADPPMMAGTASIARRTADGIGRMTDADRDIRRSRCLRHL